LLLESFSVWKDWFCVFLAATTNGKTFSFANPVAIYRVAASLRAAAITFEFNDLERRTS
jgi:hypothetical protein